MAEAFYRQLAGSYLATSAGTLANDNDPPLAQAIAVMDELGIDMRSQSSQRLSQSLIENADLVILFPTTYNPPYIHENSATIEWNNSDPYYYSGDDQLAFMRRTRDDIRSRVVALIDQQTQAAKPF